MSSRSEAYDLVIYFGVGVWLHVVAEEYVDSVLVAQLLTLGHVACLRQHLVHVHAEVAVHRLVDEVE